MYLILCVIIFVDKIIYAILELGHLLFFMKLNSYSLSLKSKCSQSKTIETKNGLRLIGAVRVKFVYTNLKKL